MVKQNSQQVLIDLQAEAKAQGASEIKNLSDDILGLAGAGSLSVEVIQSLNYALSTLQSSKGLKGFQNIRNELAGLLKQLKTIMSMTNSKGMTRTSAKQAYSKVYENTVAAVGRTKANNGYALTTEEARITKVLESASLRIDQTTTALLQASEKLSEFASKVSSPEGAKQYAVGAVEMAKAAIDIDANEINKRSKSAAARRNRAIAERQESLNDYLINSGRADAYNAAAVSGRIARAKKAELEAENMESKYWKNKYLGSNFTNNLRMGFGRLETEFHQRRGLTGVVSRFGENLFKNSKFGDVFNQGIAGAGVNLGGIAFGGAAMGIAALGKGIVDLSKASIEAYENIEKVKTQLGVVYGTQGEADSMFGKISQYAIKSPFGVKDVAEQATILKQSGVAEYELMPVLKSLGDLAGGNTEKMNRLANAVSQIAASGTATARQMRMFTMAGVPIYKAIADVKGIERNDVRTQIQKGNVTYEDIVKALEKLTQEGGPFYKAVEKGARTLAARKQNLADIKELALAETAQVKNLGIGEPMSFAGINKWWTSVQEDFFQSLYDNRKTKRIQGSVREAAVTEDVLDSLDTRITNSTNPDEIRYLKVLKMNVESMSTMSKDQREAALAEGYIYGNEKLLDLEFQRLEAANLAKTFTSSTATQTEKESVAKYLKSIGVDVDKHARSAASSAMGVYDYSVNFQKLDREIEKARKQVGELSPRSKGMALETSNRAYLKEVNQRPLGQAGQGILDTVKALYEQSKTAEDERKKQEEEKKKELVDIYNEMKAMGLGDKNVLGFLSNTMGVSEAVEKMGRYTTIDDEALSFSPKDFAQSYKTLTTQLKEIGPAFLNGVSGSGRDAGPFKDLIDKLLDPAQVMNLQQNFRVFTDMVEGLGGETKELGQMMLQNRKSLEIDEKYLNFEDKDRKGHHSLNTAYSSLIRRQLNSVFGISLERLLKTDFGTVGHTRDTESTAQITKLMQNTFNRNINSSIATAMLKNGYGYQDVSRKVSQSSADIYKRYQQDLYKKNGSLANSGASYGRFRFNFIDQERSANNFASFALNSSNSNILSAYAQELSKQVEQLDTFFVKTMTEGETQENSQRLRDLRAWNQQGKLTEDEQKELKRLEEENVAKQLYGVSEISDELRTQLSSLSHQIIEASDGTMQYSEVILNAIDTIRKENAARQNSTAILAGLQKSVEELGVAFQESRLRMAKNGGVLAYSPLLAGVDYQDRAKTFANVETAVRGNSAITDKLKRLGYSEENAIEIIFGKLFSRDSKLFNGITTSQILNLQQQDKERTSLKEKINNPVDKDNDVLDSSELEEMKRQVLFIENKVLETVQAFDPLIQEYNEAIQWLNDKNQEIDPVVSEISKLVPVAAATARMERISEQSNILGGLIDFTFNNNIPHRASIINPEPLYYGNNWREQALLDKNGLSKNMYSEVMANIFGALDKEGNVIEKTRNFFGIDEKGEITNKELTTGSIEPNVDAIIRLVETLKSLGLSTQNLVDSGIIRVDNNGRIGVTEEVRERGLSINQQAELGYSTSRGAGKKDLIADTEQRLKNLKESMKNTFNQSVVSGISSSMEALGESMATGADSAEAMGKALNNVAANMLKTVGPAMTECGLAIATEAAKEGEWGRVIGGLGLAAAGGFLSWSGGLMSGKENDDDKDAQREARLKSLADILSDLIAQARTDAEYYERNARHRQALSEDYSLSSRSVNDMIITPEGTFSTHPEDTIIAMKHPEELGSKNSSPNVTITIVNQSGDTVKVASTEKREDANGDIDIKATIVAVTADAVASGELDGAFAQMQARQRGVSRTY